MRASAGVLGGGNSTRMGEPKAFARCAGQPMVDWVLDALPPGDHLVAGGPSPDPRWGAFDVRVVDDPGQGPLGGMLSCAAAAKEDVIVFAPCDTPLVSRAMFVSLLDALHDHDAAIAMRKGHGVPVLGAYERTAFIRAGRAAWSIGERAPRRILDALDVTHLEVGDAALDADTPETLALVEARLLSAA